ncbi:MAG: zonular occludens toxin domain-containing protein [Desulfobulbaceae bacterium]|nr:zonular occludens toxin domain-containing protein [Desulfobulbaceae bacterium]
MIIGFVGNPGSGKTYDGVRKIIDNLRLGRVVFTNIDGMDKKECQEAIKSVACLSDYALARQLHFLNKDQIEDFWNHVEPGSLVVLDEIHKYFSSRDWQETKNKQFGYWASTHRHQGFDLILISQRPERIDSAVRSLFEWCYFYRKVNFFGGAVQKKYLRYSYPGEDISGPPLAKSTRTYYPQIFPCYKSYIGKDVKELGIMTHVNVLKHPVFFLIPLVFGLCLYLVFFKSSFKDGDLFGAQKMLASAQASPPAAAQKKTEISPESIDPGHSPSIRQTINASGAVVFSNRNKI